MPAGNTNGIIGAYPSEFLFNIFQTYLSHVRAVGRWEREQKGMGMGRGKGIEKGKGKGKGKGRKRKGGKSSVRRGYRFLRGEFISVRRGYKSGKRDPYLFGEEI